jgi:hypothetical protein
LESVDFAANTFDVDVTLPAPLDAPLDEPMRNSLAIHLAARINEAVEAKKAEGLNPVGIASSKITSPQRPRRLRHSPSDRYGR